jgi:hypothetical protein
MALFNPAYTQLINQRVPQTSQPQQRPMGFGNNFIDTPPKFVGNKKEDNKIERTRKESQLSSRIENSNSSNLDNAEIIPKLK